MPQTQLTPTQFMADRTLEDLHGVTLEEFLTREHAAGLSLEGISHKLLLETNGRVSVTISTIRRWLADFEIGGQS